jgi:NAD-dependent deacetylase
MRRAFEAVRRAELVIVAGTSGLVYPAAGLPRQGRQAGATVVEVNPERTPLSDDVDEYLAGPAASVLPELARAAGVAPGEA